ncbi:MAG: hypothetical protein WDW38_004957 [Sanguina aurantia]
MAVSAIFFLDVKGRVIVFRDYRGDVSPKYAEKFMAKINEMEENGKLTPVIYDEGVSYVYLQPVSLCVVSSGKLRQDTHTHPMLPAVLIRRPAMSFIKTDAYKLESAIVKPPMAVTNAVSWRMEGIKHKKNEVFLDVVESVNLLVSSTGQVVLSEVSGVLKMRVFLTGMPECKLGLNDKVLFESQGRTGKQKAVELEDIKFHQCVRLARIDNDRNISFIPPDGAFVTSCHTASARTSSPWCGWSACQFKERSAATNVEIILPLPADATAPVTKCSQGTAVYVPEKSALVWTIKSFPGGKEFMLRTHFNLPSVEAEEDGAGGGNKGKMPPIKVKFELPYFTVSGVQVRYLKVIEKSGYQALPWVRYITTAGNYEIRMQ